VGLFRRKQETLNERLLREAGLDEAGQALGGPQPLPESSPEPDPLPELASSPVSQANLGHQRKVPSSPVGHVVTVRAASLPGDRIEFRTLPNGDIIVEEERGDGDLAPLAEAVERHIDTPYRAIASRQDGDVWAVGARRIQVAEFALAEGDAIQLIANDGAQEVRVDGEPSDAQVPALVRLGERKGPSYCVEAERIDGDFWEVMVNAL
jgi:hypothetical protein